MVGASPASAPPTTRQPQPSDVSSTPPLPPPAPELEEAPLEVLLDAGSHVPALHTPPAHGESSGFAGFEQAPVAASQLPASWHSSLALQTTGAPASQSPALHVSVIVHLSPSSHAAPSAFGGFEQAPVAGSQVPGSWHMSGIGHDTGAPGAQLPITHASAIVHASPSSQVVPSALAGVEHVPVARSHAPASWHWSRGGHVTGIIPVQTPPWQVSVCVHASESLHPAPSIWFGFVQTPVIVSQTPAT